MESAAPAAAAAALGAMVVVAEAAAALAAAAAAVAVSAAMVEVVVVAVEVVLAAKVAVVVGRRACLKVLSIRRPKSKFASQRHNASRMARSQLEKAVGTTRRKQSLDARKLTLRNQRWGDHGDKFGMGKYHKKKNHKHNINNDNNNRNEQSQK